MVGTVNRADTDSKKLASMMIGRELVASQYEKKDCSDAEIAVELSHVDYHKESKHNGLNDMSLTVHRGEIVGIAGVDGNGQTQLAQLITGVISPDSGTLSLSRASGWLSLTPMASLRTAFPTCRRTATCRASSATCPSRRIWC